MGGGSLETVLSSAVALRQEADANILITICSYTSTVSAISITSIPKGFHENENNTEQRWVVLCGGQLNMLLPK